MAQMIPNLTNDQIVAIRSNAEQKFYRACKDQLPDHYLVLHSVNFVTSLSGRQRDGEADFVVFCPEKGFIVVEIKGGGISFDPARNLWFSENRKGKENEIKNPFAQGKKEKHAIIKILQGHPEWKSLSFEKVTIGHAAFFSDLDSAQLGDLVTPESPVEIMGANQNLDDLPKWITAVFEFWIGDEKFFPLSEAGMLFIRKVFCTPKKVRPLLSHILRDEDSLRLELTAQQFWYLRALGARKRAAITGGAGTGKTLLAMHKAQELAGSGKKTLLVCYNAPLADHLKDVAGRDLKDYLHPMGFHELCAWRIREVYRLTGLDLEEEARQTFPTEDRFHVQLPYALALSKDYLQAYQYDAIIVDEGQDFGADYWMALEMLLKDEKESCFYIFYDPNQALYHSADHIQEIMQGDYPFPLTSNCRNTIHIHTAAYRFYKGEQIEPPKIEGEPIQIICQDSTSDQRKHIHGLISDLIGRQGIKPKEIVVLIAGRNLEKYSLLLSGSSLPNGVAYSSKRHRVPNTILVESVGRFKGLEASIIILWDVDEFDLEEDREALYVAFSRAKSRFFITGTAEACRKVREASF
jgi:hypothetical protein